MDAVIAAIMARSKAASGTAVFVDPVILRQILQPVINELAELRQRDRVISHQLELRAGGRDALTQSLIAENDRLLELLRRRA